MRQSKKARRRARIVKGHEVPGVGLASRRPAATPSDREPGPVPTPQVMLDEPASPAPTESPETDIAPTLLDHIVAGRPESVETDVSPSVIEQDAQGGPDACSERDADNVSAEDLH